MILVIWNEELFFLFIFLHFSINQKEEVDFKGGRLGEETLGGRTV